jgi:DNA mismatch endonuclease (patch repair protein)
MEKPANRPPGPSSPSAQKRMRSVRQRDTELELNLRSALHRLGLRFRLHQRIIPNRTRTADIALIGAKVAVFVDGCFWHSCPLHKTVPKANRAWWRNKLRGNVLRDRESDRMLQLLGWQVIRVWQHDNFYEAAETIRDVVTQRQRQLLQSSQVKPKALTENRLCRQGAFKKTNQDPFGRASRKQSRRKLQKFC